MPSGIAVRASVPLWMVSPSRATDPDAITTNACSNVVRPSTASEIRSVRRPKAEASMAWSTWSAASWLCGATR